uniref:Uncharacterized protein n=1 Tax=Rhizophora mucronata TaxID=61149 RepID=A0A2P2QEM6_RHIMU
MVKWFQVLLCFLKLNHKWRFL